MKLSELKTGEYGKILSVGGEGAFRKRILEMGFVAGKTIKVIRNAPLKDPVNYRIMNYDVSLRRQDAELVEVRPLSLEEVEKELAEHTRHYKETEENDYTICCTNGECCKRIEKGKSKNSNKRIKVAMVGNPNCGKTSIFNIASGAHEKVGNYSGVTVDASEAHFTHADYRIDIVDLPGSYSLSPYSPEELFIRDYLTKPSTKPDIVIDVIDVTNLERNLYLTVQLKELGIPMVCALNMFDEFRNSNSKLNINMLSTLLDCPLIPTVGRVEEGINDLLDAVIDIYEHPEHQSRDIRVSYGTVIEPAVETLTEVCSQHLQMPIVVSNRYLAVKLLEEDADILKLIQQQPKGEFVLTAAKYELTKARQLLGNQSVETVITDQRYGFIDGALRETYHSYKSKSKTKSYKIDDLLLNRFWGLPIFVLFLILMFQGTFTLGAYPQDWIEALMNWLGAGVSNIMPEGPLTDLIVDGIIAGVGGVIVFLPQIILLYLFISIMEDTGYMARATFLMDRLMHGMGLHGKSFIPLIMGFGCNVPAVMATRTIESKQSRLITMLITPLMSCSARLPVYVLLAGAFFPKQAGIVLFAMYALGIILAIAMAWLFRKSLFKKEDLPFVMELPPYRWPTTKSILIHMWEKSRQYLAKMGTIILGASIIIWFLGYFPREEVLKKYDARIEQVQQNSLINDAAKQQQIVELKHEAAQEQQRTSLLGKIGRSIEPVLAPLGFDWKMSIAIASGLPAKEVVVSTMGVIYTGDSSDDEAATKTLEEKLQNDVNSNGVKSFTPLIAITFMVFVLIYFPCIATVVAIGRESGKWKWALFVILYTCSLAWIVAYIVHTVGTLMGY